MTYMGSAVALWSGRANQAWGASRQWNVNNSFETDLGAMTTDRNYWKTTVAHDDPNVWDNRYNAGYSAGYSTATTDKQPPASVAELTASAGEFLYSGVQTYCAVTVNRTGYWFVIGQATSVTVSAGILLRFNWNGAYQGDSYNWNPPTNNEKIGTLICASARLITSGQQIAFAGDAGGTAARTGTHTLRAVFVPTAAYPH